MPAKKICAHGIWIDLKNYSKPLFRILSLYFHKYASYSEKKLLKFANKVWNDINLLNLEQNILPTRFRADLILEKGECHFVRGIRIRKI